MGREAGRPGARPLRARARRRSRGSSRSRGGQQARFQILLLELSGATLLLLDEPTDNLDVQSAEALEDGLEAFEGTVVAVTHDRWFARGFDRFLVYGADGEVYESDGPVWDEGRVQPRPLTRRRRAAEQDADRSADRVQSTASVRVSSGGAGTGAASTGALDARPGLELELRSLVVERPSRA